MERCKDCKFYTTLYIPPCKFFDNVRQSLNADDKNCQVCSAFLQEANEVMWLGQGDEADNGMCEMFTEKENEK